MKTVTVWNFNFKASTQDIIFQLMLAFVLVFNILDGAATIFVVGIEKAYEANPIMAFLLNIHPIVFMIGKLFLVSTGVLLMWKHRSFFVSKFGIVLIFLVYYGLMIMHIESVKIFLEYISK